MTDALIPFYIFNCEQDFEGYDTDQEKLEQLKELYRGIIERLEELVNQNKITAFDKGTILELSSDVVKELAHKYGNMTEGIGEIMSGTMIETDARKILDQGINIGISQGEARGEKKGEARGEKKGQRKAEVLLTTLLQQRDPTSDDFQLAIKGTSEDRERLYKKYEIVYEVVGEEEKKDDTAEDKKD